MNQFSKTSIILLTALFLAACGLSIQGSFVAHQNLTFLKKEFFGSKKINISAGSYSASTTLNNNKITLGIKNSSNTSTNIDFKVPSENIPTDGSWVSFSASQTGQPYDVRSSILKETSTGSQIHKGQETCNYQQCQTVCRGRNDCYRECRPVSGTRYVEYRIIFTDWTTKFHLYKNGNQHAKFYGERHDQDREYTHTGVCR